MRGIAERLDVQRGNHLPKGNYMVDIEVVDETTLEEKMAVINGKTAKTKTPQPVRWVMIWAIGVALLFAFFEVVDRFYASLP
ncbi:MAG: hypothetical protein Q7S86_03950 [bacterium]|nr:hypothetical protein [bacterium]